MSNIESFDTNEFKVLSQVKQEPCISIFVPTARAGREDRQGPINLKNLIKEVETELETRGERWDQIAELLTPAKALEADVAFWEHQGEGLAIFITQGVFRVFGLPIAVECRQVVGEAFEFTPLLPLLSNDGRFYILSLSENDVNLLDATRYGFTQVKIDGIPSSMKDALGEEEVEKQQQHNGGADGPSTQFGSGHTGGSDDHNSELKRYFDRVDATLTPFFNRRPAPVVLAGVQYLLPIYRTANTSAKILDGEVHGNQDHTSAEQLHLAAWKVAEPHFAEAESRAKDLFHQLLGTGGASDEALEIEGAADGGRVATLFVAMDDKSSSSVSRAAVTTLSKGGAVFAMAQEDMPTGQALAAIFRY